MLDINAIIASAIPVQPPDEWFEDPRLTRATPIRVQPDGRVFGHVASWDSNHIGMPNGVRPPRSRSGYAYFRTGEILTAGGSLLPVGQLTLAGGHAGLEATAQQAVKHYDDTQSAIADVAVGEDSYGIWVAGALRSTATPEQIRALRASAPSGDWRMINGRLEMVAVCQVNVPGFPIPRALAAGGQRYSLVAAGAMPLLAQVMAEQEFEARLERLESAEDQRQQEQLALVASAARGRFEALRQASLSHAAEMARLRVRDPKKYAQLQALTASVSQAKREKAKERGNALPDGSFPINNVEDLKNAIHAYGRAKDKRKVKSHIISRAQDLKAMKHVPPDWSEAALQAAGDFSKLPAGFLSEKAKKQSRDSNGRFLNGGSFVRWRDKNGHYQYGQVLHGNVQADGTLQVRQADDKSMINLPPKSLEKIRAILPSDQVDNSNDRGIPFKKGQGIHSGSSFKGTTKGDLGSSMPSADPAVVTAGIEASDQADDADSEGWEPNGDYSSGAGFDLNDPVCSAEDGTPLGTVTDATDPDAIEVVDPNGLVAVYTVDELDLAQPDDEVEADPIDAGNDDETGQPIITDNDDEEFAA